MSEEETITEEEWRVIEKRIETMPKELHIGLLGNSYTKKELIKQVKDRTEVGQAYAEMQLEFIKWLTKQSKII